VVVKPVVDARDLKVLNEELRKLADTSKLGKLIATNMKAETQKRIFLKGENKEGNKIGKYKNGEYKKAKQKVQGKASFVNLVGLTDDLKGVSGQMRAGWDVIGTNTFFGLGFDNTFNSEKAETNEKRFGETVFEHTEDELEKIDKVIQEWLNDIIK
jgi:hypothetical protein